jgi:hypothetical protein
MAMEVHLLRAFLHLDSRMEFPNLQVFDSNASLLCILKDYSPFLKRNSGNLNRIAIIYAKHFSFHTAHTSPVFLTCRAEPRTF